MSCELLSDLGVFVRRAVFDDDECAHIVREARSSPKTPAGFGKRDVVAYDEEVRKSERVELRAETVAQIEQRLRALAPEVGGHFGVSLSGCQRIHVLRYADGGMFRPHRDQSSEEGVRDAVRERRVSAVLFLNRQADEPADACYCGGELTLYGLIPGRESLGVPVRGEPGLVVAFPSAETLHAVSRVTAGDRFTAVCWFV
ncbi:MAG TPA: 2OG-Fe(II) oxygenase [Candidatus Binatia bacterium]|nr:2OG-Fe(II) oxygenase [Candidatus Binatia bacterium]